jgi:hypothetical protein
MWTVDGDLRAPLAAIGSASPDSPHRRDRSGTATSWPTARERVLVPPVRQTVRPPQPPLPSLAEALRFDISPEWVSHRWQQVWTRPSGDDLASSRVTLVSGTRLTDLAGSLTYYFDQSHQLQRIEVDGNCGDPSELIMILTRYYHFQPMPAVGGYQFVVRGKRNQIVSAIRIDHAHVVQQSQPFERYRVHLELHRPGGNVPISDRLREMLDLPPSDADKLEAKAGKETMLLRRNSSSSSSKSATSLDSEKRRPLDALLPHSR